MRAGGEKRVENPPTAQQIEEVEMRNEIALESSSHLDS
jgi:hypothetical protein